MRTTISGASPGPDAPSPSPNAMIRLLAVADCPGCKKPMRHFRAGCATARSGHAAAMPPSAVINSRRFIEPPRERLVRVETLSLQDSMRANKSACGPTLLFIVVIELVAASFEYFTLRLNIWRYPGALHVAMNKKPDQQNRRESAPAREDKVPTIRRRLIARSFGHFFAPRTGWTGCGVGALALGYRGSLGLSRSWLSAPA